MTTKSIMLAVADPQALVDVTQALGADWEATSVASEEEALAQLEKRPFDALLVDFNLCSPDASELLNQALQKRPETIRFLVAYESDLALVAAKVEGTPQILPKPVEPASIKTRIENAVTDPDSKDTASDASNSPGEAPAIPPIYSEVLTALETPGVTNKQVGEIIAKDAALTSEVLKLTNSTHLGMPRDITDPVEAVESLGLDTVKAVVMALQFLAENSRLRRGYLSLDQIWQHSVNVGQIARDLVLFETKDRALASQALIAGLLHDLGKVVLAANFDDLYGRVHSLASKQPVTLWDVEKEMFGANHGEIGACLLGMWNMPSAIVEAAASHHEPALDGDAELTPLAAVHIANVLERELGSSDQDVMVAPIINTPFLNHLGLLQRLPVWRAAFANRRSGDLETYVEPAETDQSESNALQVAAASRSANYLPGPAPATQTGTSGQSANAGRTHANANRSWVYATVGLGVLLLLVLWLKTEPDLNNTEAAYARTPAQLQRPADVPSVSSRQTTTGTAPENEAAVAEQAPAGAALTPPASGSAVVTPSTPATADLKPAIASLPPGTKPVSSASTPELTASTSQNATPTNVRPPGVAPEKSQPEFRLNAIFYTPARPTAIVNGETVTVGDELNGATVVAITRTTVTLLINGQRKAFGLR